MIILITNPKWEGRVFGTLTLNDLQIPHTMGLSRIHRDLGAHT